MLTAEFTYEANNNTRSKARIKYGTWYHIPYCHEYVAIALHNDFEIVSLRFPALDIAETINELLWLKKKKKKIQSYPTGGKRFCKAALYVLCYQQICGE